MKGRVTLTRHPRTGPGGYSESSLLNAFALPQPYSFPVGSLHCEDGEGPGKEGRLCYEARLLKDNL